jgi:hypothetical protein
MEVRMRWRTLIPAVGLLAVTLALPGTVAASHRHSRSCGHAYHGSGYYSGGYYAAPYDRTDYYYAPPPGYYYRPYYRPHYRPYYRPYCPPYYRPTGYFSFGIRF